MCTEPIYVKEFSLMVGNKRPVMLAVHLIYFSSDWTEVGYLAASRLVQTPIGS